jgi:hypothetical protein
MTPQWDSRRGDASPSGERAVPQPQVGTGSRDREPWRQTPLARSRAWTSSAACCDIARLWKTVRDLPDTDKRMTALARTNIEQGFMWLVRAVFRPDTEFDKD